MHSAINDYIVSLKDIADAMETALESAKLLPEVTLLPLQKMLSMLVRMLLGNVYCK